MGVKLSNLFCLNAIKSNPFALLMGLLTFYTIIAINSINIYKI